MRRSIVYHVSNTEVEIGSNRVYAAIHQFGGRVGHGQSVTIEARNYLSVNSENEGAIMEMAEDHIDIENR